mmetsp:Transcript_1214/g.2456  ORF Transcript_1214/g.2456 Transcript_1214/m.2456 type:complete len:119 (-) Transcript_1214:206-562(-)
MIAITSTATRALLRNSTVVGRRCLSVQGQEAVGRLKDALEQYRVQNYQQEIPTRFKKDMVSQCQSSDKAVEGIEGLLQNIGVFGEQVTHDDVECIVSELGQEEKDATIRADAILSKIL